MNGDTIMNILFSAIVILIIKLAIGRKKPEEHPPKDLTENEIMFSQTCNILDKMNSKRKELYNVEQALNSIEIAHEQELKGIKLVVPSATGTNFEVSIIVGKNDEYTKKVTEILHQKRSELRYDIGNLIQTLNGKEVSVKVSENIYSINPEKDGN